MLDIVISLQRRTENEKKKNQGEKYIKGVGERRGKNARGKDWKSSSSQFLGLGARPILLTWLGQL
jgi:hypothetical protein